MPLGTVELQVKSSAFVASRLVKFIHRPFCPPSAKDGFQVQRIAVEGAQVRNNRPADFPVWYVDTRVPPYDDGLVPTEEASGFQAQLALNVALYFTQATLVEKSPNQLVEPIDALRPVVVLDLDCYPLDGVMTLRTPRLPRSNGPKARCRGCYPALLTQRWCRPK